MLGLGQDLEILLRNIHDLDFHVEIGAGAQGLVPELLQIAGLPGLARVVGEAEAGVEIERVHLDPLLSQHLDCQGRIEAAGEQGHRLHRPCRGIGRRALWSSFWDRAIDRARTCEEDKPRHRHMQGKGRALVLSLPAGSRAD